jgi:hypothetical protein
MARIEEAKHLYDVVLNGIIYPVFKRKSEEKTMKPQRIFDFIKHGIATPIECRGTMYSDYFHGLSEVFVANNFIFIEAIDVPLDDIKVEPSMSGMNLITVKYKNRTKFTLVEDPVGFNENQKAIDQIKAYVAEMEKRNAVKDAFVKPREPEAPIEIEENEMPKVVVRYMGRNTLRNFFKFFGTNNWQYKEEGNKVWLRTPLGWEPLVDGIYIVLYGDGVFGTLSEDEFAESYGQYSRWVFDDEGLAKSVISKQGIHIFGGLFTVAEQKEFEEAIKNVSPVAVATTESKREVKSTHLAYTLAEGGNEVEGYELINNKTGRVAAKFYDETLAKRVEINLNREDKTADVIKQINSAPMDATVSASKINIDNAKCTITDRIGKAESIITVTDDRIQSKVGNDSCESVINQTGAGEITISANHICLDGKVTMDDIYDKHRQDFMRNGRKKLFSYVLDAKAPQMECMAALQHEIVHILTREGYASNERDFTYTKVPRFGAVMTFRLQTELGGFAVEVLSTTNECLSYKITFYEVGVN